MMAGVLALGKAFAPEQCLSALPGANNAAQREKTRHP